MSIHLRAVPRDALDLGIALAVVLAAAEMQPGARERLQATDELELAVGHGNHPRRAVSRDDTASAAATAVANFMLPACANGDPARALS